MSQGEDGLALSCLAVSTQQTSFWAAAFRMHVSTRNNIEQITLCSKY